MIGKLSGILSEKNPPQVLVDCQGVGYEVDVPMSTFYNLPAVGAPVSLLTHFVVREDAQILYGFASAEERTAFRQLIKISGVGPRMALGVLSGSECGRVGPSHFAARGWSLGEDPRHWQKNR
jgi:holliday junction DNA helicase RuvA